MEREPATMAPKDEPSAPITSTEKPQVVEKKRRRSNPFLVTLVAFLLIAGGGIAGYLVSKLVEPSSTPEQPVAVNQQAGDSQGSTPSSSEIVKEVTAKLTTSIVPTKVNSNGQAETTEKALAAYRVPSYQAKNFAFSTSPATQHGFTTASDDMTAIQKDLSTARGYLTDKGLYASSAQFDGGATLMNDFYSTSVICTVGITDLPYPTGKYQVQFGCADTSSYVENATTLKPLHEAYLASNKQGDATSLVGLWLGKAKITESKTDGYRNAQVPRGNIYAPVGGTQLLFYQTPDSTWHYFTDVQNTPSCKDYSSADLKKAYAGEKCLDEVTSSESTVK